MLVVMATALPRASTTERWVVEGRSAAASGKERRPSRAPGVPGAALPIERPGSMRRLLRAR